ncbi:hypothetical protein MHU86_18885 [Fragilaria crotonensis]|nr:hypothetical protein MHU86_18885 [Fragilaria crotonensis]
MRSVVVHQWQFYLWTLGALLASLYNTSIWTVAACAVCAPGGRFATLSHLRWVGKILVFVIVFATAAIAIVLVIYRANVEGDTVIEKDFNGVVEQIDIENAMKPQANLYLKAWAVQLPSLPSSMMP